MTDTLPVAVSIRWYAPDEGGRALGPPPGPRYNPTARFGGQPLDDMFSVILELAAGRRTEAMVRPGLPENVPDFHERLAHGETLVLHEGRAPVAEVVIRSSAAAVKE